MLLKGSGDDTATSIPHATANLCQGIQHLKGFQESSILWERKGCSLTSLEEFKICVEFGRWLSLGKLAPTHCLHHRTVPKTWNPRSPVLPVVCIARDCDHGDSSFFPEFQGAGWSGLWWQRKGQSSREVSHEWFPGVTWYHRGSGARAVLVPTGETEPEK